MYTVTNTSTVQATDINQLVNVLQQPSGGQEKGKYFLGMPGYTNNATCSTYMPSLSRGSTPVSVSLDAADQANIGYLYTPAQTGHLTPGGLQIYDFTNGASPNPIIAGNITIQF